MKNIKLLLVNTFVLITIVIFSSFKAKNADAILGTWKEKDGTKTIQIYKVDESYFGKITENLSKDENKIKPGTVIMKNFVYKDEEWKGIIEIPTRDLSLKCKITMDGDNQMTSVATIVFVGKSKTWVRVK